MTGYYMLLLPDLAVWQGFYLNPMSFTDTFLAGIRRNLASIPFDPSNVVIPGNVFPELNLKDADVGSLVILGSMLIHDALAFSLTGICAAADGIVRITNRPFFWIEGRLADNDCVECSMGLLGSRTVEMAQIEATLLGIKHGYA